jgi:hypothetical protein
MMKIRVFHDLVASYNATPRATINKGKKPKQVWRWNLKARNGRIVCTSGEPFASHAKALRAAYKMLDMLGVACDLVDEKNELRGRAV